MPLHAVPDGLAPNVLSPVVFDVSRRYVRLRERRHDGYVEFDFSIGDPALSVGLVMAEPDYLAFCLANHVTQLSTEEAIAIDADQQKWRFGRPGVIE